MQRNKWFLYIVVLAISSLLWSSVSLAEKAEPKKEPALSPINEFGLELYQKLKSNDNNLFFSPYSISVALSMVCAGARGETRDQITKVTHSKSDRECLPAAFETLNRDMADSNLKGNGELRVANGLWLQKGFDFNQDYLKVMKDSYGAQPNVLDFNANPEFARNEINKWVAQQTRDKIQDLMTKGSIDKLTRFVLANAIYFKGRWNSEFDKKLTKDSPFTSLDGKKTCVPMMHQDEMFGYSAGDGFQVLAMPYKEGHLSMVVLLPSEGVSLKNFDERLNPNILSTWIRELKNTKVDVYFPKFKMTTPVYLLDPILKDMGMTKAFSKDADISGMSPSKDLYISTVAHKAFVDVNEEGTEAAAATGIAVRSAAMAPKKIVFKADRPFLFFIRHDPTDTILFFGRFIKP